MYFGRRRRREPSICMQLSFGLACLGAFVSGAMGYTETPEDEPHGLRDGLTLADSTCSPGNIMQIFYGLGLELIDNSLHIAATDCTESSNPPISCGDASLPEAHKDPSMGDPGAWGDWRDTRAACTNIIGSEAQKMIYTLCDLSDKIAISELANGSFLAKDAEVYATTVEQGATIYGAASGDPIAANATCIAEYLVDHFGEFSDATASDSARISALRTQAVGGIAALIALFAALGGIAFYQTWKRTHGGEAPTYAAVCEELQGCLARSPARTCQMLTYLWDRLTRCCRSNPYDAPGTFTTSGGYHSLGHTAGVGGTPVIGEVALTSMGGGASAATASKARDGGAASARYQDPLI